VKIPGIEHFELEELVSKEYIDRFGGQAKGLLDMPLTRCIDRLRKAVGPITINNWHKGGHYHESGLRVPCTVTGAKFSMHRFGKAYDLKPKSITVMELYNHIMHYATLYPEIRRIENPEKTPSWLHVDSFNHPGDGILIVQP
jgi:hypothetical protein